MQIDIKDTLPALKDIPCGSVFLLGACYYVKSSAGAGTKNIGCVALENGHFSEYNYLMPVCVVNAKVVNIYTEETT